MKANKKIFIVVLILVLALTGCTKQLKDADGKVVQDKKTNQTLVENILCKPVELKETYETAIEEKKKDLKKLYKEGEISKKEYFLNVTNKNLSEILANFTSKKI